MKAQHNGRENRIRNKLKSQTGASISFALLLFLVCAVISAAVLVAGATASGRMSGLAETDQSYYTVTSTAEMIKDLLDGRTVSTFDYGGTHYTFDEKMIIIDDSYLQGKEGKTTIDSFPELIAAKCAGSDTSIPNITFDSSNNKLDATVSAAIDGDRNIIFTISNSTGSEYVVKLYVSTDVRYVNPPLTKLDGTNAVSNSKEVTFHVDNMISSYDENISSPIQ